MIEAAQSYDDRKEKWKNEMEKPKKISKPLNRTTTNAESSKVRFKSRKSLRIQPTTHTVPYNLPDKWNWILSTNVYEKSEVIKLKIGDEVDLFFSDTNEWRSGIVINVEKGHGTSNAHAVLRVNDQTGEGRVVMTNQLWYFRVNQNPHPIMEFIVSTKERLLVDDMLQFVQRNQGELIAKLGFSIYGRDFSTLRVRSWLSDSVIDGFSRPLLMESKHRKGRDFFTFQVSYAELVTIYPRHSKILTCDLLIQYYGLGIFSVCTGFWYVARFVNVSI